MQDSRQYAIYVAELCNGQIAGWVGAYLFRSIETGSCAEINGLVVDEGVRSREIGKLLLSAIEEWGQRLVAKSFQCARTLCDNTLIDSKGTMDTSS